jgi:molybdopterin synthase sulfur carrier subunit
METMPNIKLFANLRKIAGTKEVSITGASIGDVVSELVKRYPALAESLLKDGQIRPHVIITINGNPITDLNAAVMEQDQIAIFPPIAGG